MAAQDDANSGTAQPVEACAINAIVMEFSSKTHRLVPLPQVQQEIEAGRFVWIDIDCCDQAAAQARINQIGGIPENIAAELVGRHLASSRIRRSEGLWQVLVEGRLTNGRFSEHALRSYMTKGMLVTSHDGPIGFLDQMQEGFAESFEQYASTPSFLIYEMWENLVESYLTLQQQFESLVLEVQEQLLQHVDDRVFEELSSAGTALLRFRGAMLSARATLTELTSRRSGLISEPTIPYLVNMVGTIERVLSEVQVDRDILSQALNLHVSMVSHRTNQTVKRLTSVSLIFLPLTFLCGVWGMNFDGMPELHEWWGYPMFWTLVILLTGAQIYFLRKKKLI